MVRLSILATLVAALPLSLAAPGWGNNGKGNGNGNSPVVNQTTCNGRAYKYQELAGFGYVTSNARDKFGDNLGGLGSALYLEQRSWRKRGNSYYGVLWALPDRGWNTEGTLNFQPRVHKFNIKFTPEEGATVQDPSGPNLQLNYVDTIRFTGPDGTPVTGLDPDADGPYLTYPGFPDLPSATYEGDGFGGPGPGGRRISVDSEGIVVTKDGSFWVSDEYGPYVYKFDGSGRMVLAIRPPEAIIPYRNGTQRRVCRHNYYLLNATTNYFAALTPLPHLATTPTVRPTPKTPPQAATTTKASKASPRLRTAKLFTCSFNPPSFKKAANATPPAATPASSNTTSPAVRRATSGNTSSRCPHTSTTTVTLASRRRARYIMYLTRNS